MKIKDGFIKRKAVDKWLVVATGELSKQFHAMIELNETGSLIWDGVAAGKTPEEITDDLLREYNVSREDARSGVDALIAQMEQGGILA